MNILAILIPVALLLGAGGLVAFFWALRSGQFEDLEGAALRIFVDEATPGSTLGSDPHSDRARRLGDPPQVQAHRRASQPNQDRRTVGAL